MKKLHQVITLYLIVLSFSFNMISAQSINNVEYQNLFENKIDSASISVDPLLIQQQVPEGDSVDVSISISNVSPIGSSELLWSAKSFILPVNKAWSISGDANYRYITAFNLDTPNILPSIFPSPFTGKWGLTAGDFGIIDQSFFYFNYGKEFFKLDTTTGTITSLGTIYPTHVNDMWYGMATDPTDGKIYLCAHDSLNEGNLYILEPDSLSATFIGSMGSNYRMNAIAFDKYGNLWGTDTLYNSLYSINKNTGVAQLIGSLGINSSFFQGMDYDQKSQQLYLSTFNLNLDQSELRIVDINTGNTTFVGRLGSSYFPVYGFLAIPGEATQRFIKFLEPDSGMISPGNSENLNVRLYGNFPDSSSSLNGNIDILSNDPINPVITVDVELSILTSINNNKNKMPLNYQLSQNYPNPFNPITTIRYQLPKTADVKLAVYNMLGQKIRTLVNENQAANYYSVQWNGLNDSGSRVSSGIYLYRIEAGDPSTGSGQRFIKTNKMLLLK